jgi:WD40 repeat protein/tRNA A-37 threonylcarbamoyl transferase component Bud32
MAETCLGDEELRAFLLGELTEDRSEAVSRHLETCAACEASAGRLDDTADAVVRSLRRALRRPPDSSVTTTLPVGAAAAPTPPARVAGYEVLSELGRGGMSVVYLARQERPGRLVALKMVLGGAHARGEERARFLAEAEAIARLSHPNIVQVHEAGTCDGLPYFSLEYLPGGSLERRLAGRPQPPAQAAALVEVLARAVQHAHEHGIVHRDLKPANVLLAADGTPKVADFGLARLEAGGLTATGAVLGTPSYMAPEQAGGDNAAVGPATDVYALGAILYEMLTGRPPFRAASTLETLAQVRSQEPVPPVQLQGQTPRDLNTVCLKCLQKDPRRRYQSALELAGDLRAFLDGRPIKARPVSPLERAWRWARRNPGWAAMFAVVFGLLGVIAVGASLSVSRLRDKVQEVQEAERSAQGQLFEALLAQAQANRLSRRPGQRFRSLELLGEANALAGRLGLGAESRRQLRNAYVGALAMPDLYPGNGWDHLEGNPAGFAVDAGWTIYARTDEKGNCSVRRLADDRQLHYIPGRGLRSYCILRPGGKSLIVRHADLRAELWGLDPGGARNLAEVAEAYTWAFQDRGPLAAFTHVGGTLTVFDLDSGRRWAAPGLAVTNPDVALHPTEPLAAVSSFNDPRRRLLFIDLARRVVRATLIFPGTPGSNAWSPDGKLLAAPEAHGPAIHLYDGRTFRLRRTLARKPGAGGGAVAFSADGSLLATCDWGGNVELFDVRAGHSLFREPSASVIGFLRFRSDGSRLGVWFLPGRPSFWHVDPGLEYRTLTWPTSAGARSYQSAVSPDGRVLAVMGWPNLAFWDLDTGEMLGTLPVGGRFLAQDPATGDLLLPGPGGLARYPFRRSEADAETVLVGPPEVHPWPGPAEIIAASADGRVIATSCRARGVRVQSGTSNQVRTLLDGVDCHWLALSPDGKSLVAPTPVGVEVREALSGKTVARLGDGSLSWARFSPDGHWLALPGNPGGLLSVPGWRQVRPFQRAGAVAFSPDSRVLATDQGNGAIRLERVSDGAELAVLEPPELAPCMWICFSPDGTRLITTSDRGAPGAKVWDLRLIRQRLRGQGLDWDEPDYPPAPPARTSPVRLDIDLRPPGGQNVPHEVRRFEVSGGWVYRAALSPDGKRAVSSGNDGLSVWEVATGALVRSFGAGQVGGMGLALSKDGKCALCGSHGHAVCLWDVEGGQELRRFVGHTDQVWAAGLSPDGKLAVTGAWDGTVRVWDVATGKEVRRFQGVVDLPRCLAWSPDGRHVAIGHLTREPPAAGQAALRLWDVATGKQVRACEGHTSAIAWVAFSPDGKRLASASFDRTARLWDADTGKELRRFVGHTGALEGVAFTPDGRRLVTCGDAGDPTLRVWDADSDKELLRYHGHADGPLGVAVTPDGKHLLSWAKDATLRLWPLPR